MNLTNPSEVLPVDGEEIPEWELREPSTPLNSNFSPTTFPPVDSRSPTKRFLLCRVVDQKSPMSVSGRFPNKFQRDEHDDDEKRHRPNRRFLWSEDEEFESDGKRLSGSSNSSTSQSTSSAATITSSAMKRQKKRERKKARQTIKKNMQNKQKLQRAEAQRQYDEKVAANKKMLAEYAAAVAKPTVAKEPKKTTAAAAATSCISTVSVTLETTSTQYSLKPSTSATSTMSSSTGKMSTTIGSCRCSGKADSGDSGLKAPAPAAEWDDFESESGEEELEDVVVENDVEYEEEGEDEDVYDEESVEDDEVFDEEDVEESGNFENGDEEEEEESEDVPKGDGEFEILICGQRRVVKPFTPRKHLQSTTSDDHEPLSAAAETSASSAFDIPEHAPYSVPFRESHIARKSTPNRKLHRDPRHQNSNNPMNPINPPVTSSSCSNPTMPFYVTMPMGPPMIIGPPIVTNFGQFPGFQPQFARPPGPIPMIPNQMPMMMNGGMFVPPGGIPVHRHVHQPLPIHPPPPPPPPESPHYSMHLQPRNRIQIPLPPSRQHPDFSQPPPPLPPRQRPLRPLPVPPPLPPRPGSPMVSSVYPGHRTMSRPIRKPLPIVTPPPLKSEPPQPSPEVKEHLELVVKEQKNSEVESVEPVERTAPDPSPRKQSSSSSASDLHEELITSGVSVILDGSDDETTPPPPPPTLLEPSQTSSEVLEDPESLNRVLGFTKNAGGQEFEIWTGFVNDLPPRPGVLKTDNLEKMMLEMDQMDQTKKRDVEEEPEIQMKKKDIQKRLTLPSICKQMEGYFFDSCSHLMGSWVDSRKMRQMFEEAHDGEIPSEAWPILRKVCSFEPGYFHVFDVLIGGKLDFTYGFKSPSGKKVVEDPLLAIWRSCEDFGSESEFLQRFEAEILQDVLIYLTERLVSARTFVAIIEAVKDADLTPSDRFYLASLVWGHRDFQRRFNSSFHEIQLIATGGKRWIRRTPQAQDPPSSSSDSLHLLHVRHAKNVSEFITQLRPHIDDILHLLPETVVDDKEFFRTAKLVCAWRGDHEELIWRSIVGDSVKYQEFYHTFRAFFRIEVRKGTLYLKKLVYLEDSSDDEVPNVIVAPQITPLPSAFRSPNHDPNDHKKKTVTCALFEDPISLINISTQTDGSGDNEIGKIWDLERELIRQLKRDNASFAEFVKSDNAREMYQFLADLFKNVDMQHFSFMLEKAVSEMREQSLMETVELRVAAEEAQRTLESARQQHKKELEEFQNKMETISRFETYEVEIELRSRIDALKERIREMTEQREAAVKEEVREEKQAMDRQQMELKRQHQMERRILEDEIARLKLENRKVLTGKHVAKESPNFEQDQAEMVTRCEHEMNKTRKVCQNTTQLLLDSQQEMAELRRENQRLSAKLAARSEHQPPVSSPATHHFLSPEPEQEVEAEPEPEPIPDTPPSPKLNLSPQAALQLSRMEKYQAEIRNENFVEIAEKMCEIYCSLTSVNRKERKCAEKQLREFGDKLAQIENAIVENIELLKLNVVDDLVPIMPFPMPFSEKIMQKLNEASQYVGEMYRREANTSCAENGKITVRAKEICAICLDVLVDGSTILGCGTCSKEYHHSCVSRWLSINSVCPMCSRTLKDPVEFPSLC